MSSFWNFAFGAVLILLWIISGGFVTQASIFLTSRRNKDPYLHSAYWNTFWAAFITWTLIALAIILVVILAVSGVGEAEAVEGATSTVESTVNDIISKKDEFSWLTMGFLILALILVTFTGVFAAASANDINKSPNYSNTNQELKKAYDDCVIAAILCLGSGGLLVIGVITYIIVTQVRKGKLEAMEQAKLKQQRLQVAGLQTLQRESAITQAAQQAQEQAALKEQLKEAVIARAAAASSSPPTPVAPATSTRVAPALPPKALPTVPTVTLENPAIPESTPRTVTAQELPSPSALPIPSPPPTPTIDQQSLRQRIQSLASKKIAEEVEKNGPAAKAYFEEQVKQGVKQYGPQFKQYALDLASGET
jgi:hypothetical protein